MILDTCVTSRNVEFNPSLPHDKPPITNVLPYKIETLLEITTRLKKLRKAYFQFSQSPVLQYLFFVV